MVENLTNDDYVRIACEEQRTSDDQLPFYGNKEDYSVPLDPAAFDNVPKDKLSHLAFSDEVIRAVNLRRFYHPLNGDFRADLARRRLKEAGFQIPHGRISMLDVNDAIGGFVPQEIGELARFATTTVAKDQFVKFYATSCEQFGSDPLKPWGLPFLHASNVHRRTKSFVLNLMGVTGTIAFAAVVLYGFNTGALWLSIILALIGGLVWGLAMSIAVHFAVTLVFWLRLPRHYSYLYRELTR